MKIIGHRGARGLAPENTLAGLQKGLEHQVDELEFDLRVTKDNIVILHHDAKVTDQDGQTHLIKQCSYAELKKHKPDLTTFPEVLQHLGNQVALYIEVKSHEPTAPIISDIKEYIAAGGSPENLSLASKSQKTLLALHAALPDIKKIVIHAWSGTIAVHRAKQVNSKRLAMNQLFLWRGFIAPMARRGWLLSAYTLNDPVKAKRWARYGLDSVVTDYPDRFVA